jgi:acyl-CoA-binding protein
MKTKKKYNVDGEKINIKGIIERGQYFKMKAIAESRGQSKDEAINEAVILYNEENKEALG